MGPVAAHWSPDGTRLLVTRQRLGGSGVADVLLMSADGTVPPPIIESGFFIEATWVWGVASPSPVVLVVGGDDGLTSVTYDTSGAEIARASPAPAIRYAVAAHLRPGDDGVLLTNALGSPEPFGPIELEDGAGRRIIAGGCGAAWSPDGRFLAYYDGLGIAIKRPETPPDERSYVVRNADLGIERPDDVHEEGCAGLGISWAPQMETYEDAVLGVRLSYPSVWQEGAPPTPYASCFECAVFGPAEAEYPYGVQLFEQEVEDADLWPASAFIGNRALPQGEERAITIDGRGAKRLQIERQAPLGQVNETGDDTSYREAWTVVPDARNGRVVVAVAYWRDGDETERETLAAYESLLASLRVE
jgi:hypothetical protein